MTLSEWYETNIADPDALALRERERAIPGVVQRLALLANIAELIACIDAHVEAGK